MADSRHIYESQVTWKEERRGSAEASGRGSIAVGAPPDFGGTPDVWSPEHLTVAAVNSCMMLSFIAVAENSRVRFLSYTSSATASLEKVEGRGMVITKVEVRPTITVPGDTDRARLDRVLQLTKKNCFISNSLTAEVTFDAEVKTA